MDLEKEFLNPFYITPLFLTFHVEKSMGIFRIVPKCKPKLGKIQAKCSSPASQVPDSSFLHSNHTMHIYSIAKKRTFST